LPGVFYAWEFAEVIHPTKAGERGEDFFVLEWGIDTDGQHLYAVFHRPHVTKEMN
jgi:hypothetical protein